MTIVQPLEEVQRESLVAGVEILGRTARFEGLEWLTISDWTPEQRHACAER
jgi:hypothetical protein